MDAARKEMKAAACFDIIEFNTQLDTSKLIVGEPPELPSTAEMNLISRANPDLADTIIENHEKAFERWLKREAAVSAIKERHEKKLQAVYRIMQKYFGRSVLARVSSFLEELDYFSAWHTLVSYYLKTGLLEKQARVDEVIHTIYYNPKYQIVDFIDYMNLLFQVKEYLDGSKMIELTKVNRLVSAIKAGTGSLFDLEITIIRQNASATVDLVAQQLIQKFNQITLDRSRQSRILPKDHGNAAPKTNISKTVGQSQNQVQAFNMDLSKPKKNAVKKGKPLCWDCGMAGVKIGHEGCASPGAKKFKPQRGNKELNTMSPKMPTKSTVGPTISAIQRQYEEHIMSLTAENSKLRRQAEINIGMRANDQLEHFSISDEDLAAYVLQGVEQNMEVNMMQKHWRGRLQGKPLVESDGADRIRTQARGDEPHSTSVMAESPLEVDRAILGSRRQRPDANSDHSIPLQVRSSSRSSQSKPSNTSTGRYGYLSAAERELLSKILDEGKFSNENRTRTRSKNPHARNDTSSPRVVRTAFKASYDESWDDMEDNDDVPPPLETYDGDILGGTEGAFDDASVRDNAVLDADFAEEEEEDELPDHYLYSLDFDEQGIALTAEEAEYLRDALYEFRSAGLKRPPKGLRRPGRPRASSSRRQSDVPAEPVANRTRGRGANAMEPAAAPEGTLDVEANMALKSTGGRADFITTAPIFDSGATHCVTPTADVLRNYRKMEDGHSMLMGGRKDFDIKILGVGEGAGLLSFIPEIFHCPGAKRIIISIPKLCNWGYITLFCGNRCFIYNSKNKMDLAMSGTYATQSGLFHLDSMAKGPTYDSFGSNIAGSNFLINPSGATETDLKSPTSELQKATIAVKRQQICDKLGISISQFIHGSAVNTNSKATNDLSPRTLCHHRANHIGDWKIELAHRNCTAIGLGVAGETYCKEKAKLCIPCFVAQFKKFPAPPSLQLSHSDRNNIIAMDLKGKFRTRSVRGNHYFNLIVHLGTTMIFFDFQRNKDDVVEQIPTISDRYLKPLGLQCKTIWSDSDVLYSASSVRQWASKAGVALEYTAPYRHEGIQESWMSTVMRLLRTIMISGNIPENCWELVLQYGVKHILNNYPNSSFPTSCPWTQATGKIPDVSNFRPIGYPAIAMIYPEERQSKSMTQPHGVRCTVLGFSDTVKNGYVIRTIPDGRILVRKDVLVDETFSMQEILNYMDRKSFLGYEEDKLVYREDPEIHAENPSTKPEIPILRRSARIKELRANKELNELNQHQILQKIPYTEGMQLPETPSNMKDAVGPTNQHKAYWLEAINNEMQEMISRGVFREATNEEYKTKVGFKSKLTFRASVQSVPSAHGQLEKVLKFKARLVACGYSQIFGLHYEKNTSPTVQYKSFLTVMHIAAVFNWKRKNLDVGNAFLEALLKEDLFMYLPYDWTGGRKILVKLCRNIYGLKQAGLLWYLLLTEVLADFGMSKSTWDPCVFFKNEDDSKTIMCLHVDDQAIVSNKGELLEKLKFHLASRFKKITDLGAVNSFLGMDINYEENTKKLIFSQSAIVNNHLQLALKRGTATSAIPFSPLINITQPEQGLSSPPNKPIWDRVGVISYIAQHTMPQLTCITGMLAQCARNPTAMHIKALESTESYIAQHRDETLALGGADRDIRLFGYCDASRRVEGDFRARIGQCWFLGLDSGAVSWKSQTSKLVSLSSTEAEIDALVEAVKDCIWMRGLLCELGFPQTRPTVIFQDNKSAIRLADIDAIPSRTRHLANRLSFIKQEVERGTVALKYLPGRCMVADILTKLLPANSHKFCTNILTKGHQCKNPESFEE
jgi:hypothetical protein